MSYSPIKQQTVVAQVMDQIRSLIASGAYTSGDRIPTEKELAGKFGIGRSSVREAIKIFNYLGVLESRAALGTFVQKRSNISTEALTWSLLLGQDEMEELIDLRGAIEMWSLASLVKRRDRNDPEIDQAISNLEGIVADMKTAVAEGRRASLVDEDYRFHQAVIQTSGNPLFVSIYETLRSFLYDEIKTSQSDYEDPDQIHAEHFSLLKGIRNDESSVVLQTYMAHIANTKHRIQKKHSFRRP